MTPRERILAIRLLQQLQDKPEFAKQIGIETVNLNTEDETVKNKKNGGYEYE